LKIGSTGYEHANEIAKANATMHEESGKIGKGETLNSELSPQEEKKFENSQEISSAAIIDSSSEIEQEMALFKADIDDEISAIVNTFGLLERESLAIEDIVSAATQNITEEAQDSLEKLNVAIGIIQNSMEGNPQDANEVKQQVIELLNNRISFLTE